MNNGKIEKEKYYDVLKNADGDVLICLPARDVSPENPQMLYGGGDKILFYRRPNETVLLDAVHPDVWENLSSVPQVLVAEYLNSGGQNAERGIIREYAVTVRQVSKLPDTMI